MVHKYFNQKVAEYGKANCRKPQPMEKFDVYCKIHKKIEKDICGCLGNLHNISPNNINKWMRMLNHNFNNVFKANIFKGFYVKGKLEAYYAQISLNSPNKFTYDLAYRKYILYLFQTRCVPGLQAEDIELKFFKTVKDMEKFFDKVINDDIPKVAWKITYGATIIPPNWGKLRSQNTHEHTIDTTMDEINDSNEPNI